MAARAGRPLIGITGPRRGALGPRTCIAWGVRLAGGRPVQLGPGRPEAPEPLDGVVISGGHDVEPVLYKGVGRVEARYDRERDAFELATIDAAAERDLPLLGICRGMQLLNVRRGGTLIPDLREHRRHTSNRRTLLPLKTLLVDEGSRVHSILRAERMRINSLHAQSVDRLGEGLRVAGRDLDDIVQAVEDPGSRFVVGVQWHPEFLLYAGRQRALFGALVEAALSRCCADPAPLR